MTYPLYTDQNIMADIVAGLRQRGLDVLTAREDGAARQPDAWLLERASALGRAFCTEDQDLLRITRQWAAEGRNFAGLIYVFQRRAGVGRLIEDIATISSVLSPEELHNRIHYAPL